MSKAEGKDAKPGVLKSVLGSLNRETLNRLDLAKSIAHPGEGGKAREQILAEFIRKFLPASLGLSTGFVLDGSGQISRQVDLVIYRTDYHPLFEIGGVKYFMIESVLGVIENKASIRSVSQLRDALNNIRSVKALDRTNKGRNYTVQGSQKGESVDAELFDHQVFGAIVTESSLGQKRLAKELKTFLRSNPKRVWPNLYVDARNFVIWYAKADGLPTIKTCEEAVAFQFTHMDGIETYPPLIQLATEMANFLRIAPLVDYRPADYLLSVVPTHGAAKWSIDE